MCGDVTLISTSILIISLNFLQRIPLHENIMYIRTAMNIFQVFIMNITVYDKMNEDSQSKYKSITEICNSAGIYHFYYSINSYSDPECVKSLIDDVTHALGLIYSIILENNDDCELLATYMTNHKDVHLFLIQSFPQIIECLFYKHTLK